MPAELRGVVAEFITAVNAFDTEAIVATFVPDAFWNDSSREIVGADSIRRFVEKEITGERVTMDVREIIEHYSNTIVRARYDGDYDKTGLPEELILTGYFTVEDDMIVSLIITLNRPSPY